MERCFEGVFTSYGTKGRESWREVGNEQRFRAIIRSLASSNTTTTNAILFTKWACFHEACTCQNERSALLGPEPFSYLTILSYLPRVSTMSSFWNHLLLALLYTSPLSSSRLWPRSGSSGSINVSGIAGVPLQIRARTDNGNQVDSRSGTSNSPSSASRGCLNSHCFCSDVCCCYTFGSSAVQSLALLSS